MARSRLVCNLGMADFFTLPDSGEIWRKRGVDPVYVDVTGKKRQKMYECESLYDGEQRIRLPGTQRVDLVDK